jgi:hypothetical protein
MAMVSGIEAEEGGRGKVTAGAAVFVYAWDCCVGSLAHRRSSPRSEVKAGVTQRAGAKSALRSHVEMEAAEPEYQR